MHEENKYKCVNCGEATGALYRTYGPSVLKLNKCESCKGIVDKYIEYDPVIVMIDLVLVSKEAQRHVIYNTEFKESCKGIVDKYIEYDPVIVMIDLVLVSKEAQRHVIYNTEFKSYWKLFIIMVLLETYGLWRSDSLFNMAVNALCHIQVNSTDNSTHLALPFNMSMPERWQPLCRGWQLEHKDDDSDLFIWEKDFYIQFTSTFAGIAAFTLTVHGLMKLLSPGSKATFPLLVKAFSLAEVSVLLTLPTLVWGARARAADADAAAAERTRALHYALVAAYSHAVFFSVFTVLYETAWTSTSVVLFSSTCAKFLTTFHVTPHLRVFIT